MSDEAKEERSALLYYQQAYFVYDDHAQGLIEKITNNEYGTKITAIHVDEMVNQLKINDTIKHIVVSLKPEKFASFLALIYGYGYSLGFVPLASEKEQIKKLCTTADEAENIAIALRDDSKGVDLVEVNGTVVYTQGIIGTAPLVGEDLQSARRSWLKTFFYALKKLFSIRLQRFEITTANGQKLVTAGSAVIILNHTQQGIISKIFDVGQSMRDGQITLVIISPYSVLEYMKLFFSILIPSKEKRSLPKAIGYIQSKSFSVKAGQCKQITFENGMKMDLPLECKVIPEAIRFNASEAFWEKNEKLSITKETLRTANLPDSTETAKLISKRIPLYPSASEERFKELFQALRFDATLDKTYLVLMVLSTMLASFGLYANSAAVVIGAMLVAPLMAPIVSLAMGLLRAQSFLMTSSVIKIIVGVVMALGASALFAYLLPTVDLTPEMLNRINPTLLDLGVAILSGIAAAYTKSYKEISQNLAGVAIAVALVPPLSVAGIALGYGDIPSFLGAFLLFFTNLVGIVLAAVVTFQLLGYSGVVKSKKGVAFVVVLLLGVMYPLSISYDQMIEKYNIAKTLKSHRFLVNDKYIIVDSVSVTFRKDVKLLGLDIAVHESLERDDFRAFREDLERLLNMKLQIETKVEYIL